MPDTRQELIVQNDCFDGVWLSVLRGNGKHDYAKTALINCALLSDGGELVVKVWLYFAVEGVQLLVAYIQKLNT